MKNFKNQSNCNNVLYVVFYYLSDDIIDFSYQWIWNFTFPDSNSFYSLTICLVFLYLQCIFYCMWILVGDEEKSGIFLEIQLFVSIILSAQVTFSYMWCFSGRWLLIPSKYNQLKLKIWKLGFEMRDIYLFDSSWRKCIHYMYLIQ